MDKELIILEQIQNNPLINQRDLATESQASLGMTNTILKRFVARGFITIKKVNNRNIRYVLTSEGMEEISARTWSSFKKTVSDVLIYQDAISKIVKQVRAEGYSSIGLRGRSDFDFIIEHVCYKQNIPYQSDLDNLDDKNPFYFIAESREWTKSQPEVKGSFSLNRLFIK